MANRILIDSWRGARQVWVPPRAGPSAGTGACAAAPESRQRPASAERLGRAGAAAGRGPSSRA
jgi:hypothetical protein